LDLDYAVEIEAMAQLMSSYERSHRRRDAADLSRRGQPADDGALLSEKQVMPIPVDVA
jgi:hypothetical protein